jgi:hypothetical protein
MPKVDLTLSHPHKNKNPGDKVSVSEDEARSLIRGGIAVPSTVSAARAVDADPADAATKR